MILAAGAGTRLGGCKALADLTPGATTPSTPLDRLLAAGEGLAPDERLVVTGAEHAAIEVAAPAGARVIRNAEWSAGRTGSVLLARRSLLGFDLCLAPVDVPLVTRAVFERLREAWSEAGKPARGWLAPAHGGAADGTTRFGHPVIVGRVLLERLGDEDRAVPLRELRSHADPLWSVEVPDAGILDDLDTPEDLERLQARLARD